MIGIDLQARRSPASTNEVRAAVGAHMLTGATDIFLMAQRGFFDLVHLLSNTLRDCVVRIGGCT